MMEYDYDLCKLSESFYHDYNSKELQLGDKKFQTNFADFLDDLKNKL